MIQPQPTVTVTPDSHAIPGLADKLRQAGYRVIEAPARRGSQWPADEMRELFAGADAIVAMPGNRYHRELIAGAPRLKLLISPVIGVDHIDVDAATELGVVVANCPVPENVNGMAEATVMLSMALLLELEAKQRSTRAGAWRSPPRSHLLWGKTVGIIGYGRIGRAVHARLQGWEVDVQFHDPYVAGSIPLDQLLRTSDVVTLQVVLNEETRNLIGARELALMKPSALLVNTSRGGTVDEGDLARAIDEGRLAGAALDVFEREPLNMDHPLLRCDPRKVILTPHAVGHNVETGPSGTAMTLRNIQRVMGGELPESVVNPAAVPFWRERLARLDR